MQSHVSVMYARQQGMQTCLQLYFILSEDRFRTLVLIWHPSGSAPHHDSMQHALVAGSPTCAVCWEMISDKSQSMQY